MGEVESWKKKQKLSSSQVRVLKCYGNNTTFVPINNPNIAINAAQIRARYNLELPDALQIAVALNAKCEAFLTNDLTFKRITELRVLVLNDFNNLN